jgi:hypothetical protein
MATHESISELLNNQPNGVRIGCGQYRSTNVLDIPFHHLSRRQQIEQIESMLECGVAWIELQRELYLVCHKTTAEVRRDFGIIYES